MSLSKIHNRSYELTKEANKTEVGLPSLTIAIMEDENVQDFLRRVQVNVLQIAGNIFSDLQNSGEYSWDESEELAVCEHVDQVVKASYTAMENLERIDAQYHGLVMLKTLMVQSDELPVVSMLKSLGLTAEAVTAYLSDKGVIFDNNNKALILADGADSSYAPVFNAESDSALSQFSVCLNDEAHYGRLPSVIGTHDVSALATPVVSNLESNNLIFSGGADELTITGAQLDFLQRVLPRWIH